MKNRNLSEIKNAPQFRELGKTWMVLVFLALLLSIQSAVAAQNDSASETSQSASQNTGLFENALAANHLEQAWTDARDAGGYSFRADIVQVAIPLAQPANIGRASREYTYHIEGTTSGLTSPDPSM